MVRDPVLRGRSIAIVGAGLSGLSAAVQLRQRGASVTVFEGRDRVGGRVLTIRDGFANGQSAEAGGDLIDEEHTELCSLVRICGLTLVPILRRGFAFVRGHSPGKVQVMGRSQRLWKQLADALDPLVRSYQLCEQRWDGVVARQLSAISVADWMRQSALNSGVQRMLVGLRGFFLADPKELSLLSLVEQLAAGTPGSGRMYRIMGGNDCLPNRLGQMLRGCVQLRHEVTALSQNKEQVRLTVRNASGEVRQVRADYVVLSVPASVLSSMDFRPTLPASQSAAIKNLQYGAVTKTLMQFDRRFWRSRGRPLAYGTDLPTGSLWDGNEEQGTRPGILSLMAGGSASAYTQDVLSEEGPTGLAKRLGWLGSTKARLLGAYSVSWEKDPWAGGGYAVFGPGYDPKLRAWLAYSHGRIMFAGEHTSLRWQGYMNGAVESGLRAAAEVQALEWERRGFRTRRKER
ncbi:MAG TPA: NAD(P)/FAD-dependent oxidoreductase [Nitrospira sp.]|nr:NAD(P)/FAD-dependent oxidoreductase [Nitrospira sp.]